MLPKFEQHHFVKTVSAYGSDISFYYDYDIQHFYAVGTNGVSCVLRDSSDLYFYKDDKFMLKIDPTKALMNGYSTIDTVMNRLQTFVFFHVSSFVADQLFSLFENKKNITFSFRPTERVYLFNYVDNDLGEEIQDMALFSYQNEMYFATTSFVDEHRNFCSFVNKYSIYNFEFYENLNRDKTVFILYQHFPAFCILHDKNKNKITISKNNSDIYKPVVDDLEPISNSEIDKKDVVDYVYKYYYDLVGKNLKPRKDYDDIDFSHDYKDVLKLYEMIDI